MPIVFVCVSHDITRLGPLSLSNCFIDVARFEARFEVFRINWAMFLGPVSCA